MFGETSMTESLIAFLLILSCVSIFEHLTFVADRL